VIEGTKFEKNNYKDDGVSDDGIWSLDVGTWMSRATKWLANLACFEVRGGGLEVEN
jgi:hypothetical protein